MAPAPTLPVMLTTVAVLPQPPLLVPELTTGAAVETAPLRDACLLAAGRLGAAASRWIAVGADDGGRRTVDPGARGTFAGFGVDVVIALDTRSQLAGTGAAALVDTGLARRGCGTRAPGMSDSRDGDVRLAGGPAPDPEMALPLLVAGWVAAAAGVEVAIRGELVDPAASPAECAALGAALADEFAANPDPVGLLVVGDGAATHTEKAPRHLDERAGPFDRAVAAALATADRAALAALDPGLAAELAVAGRAPWQVLAAAARGDWAADIVYSDAPYGVAYHVAVWDRRS